MKKTPRVSVVGATGLVGRAILDQLEKRNFPLEELTLFGSARSAGTSIEFRGDETEVLELTPEAFRAHTDLALCSAGRKVSYMLRDWLEGTDIVVVDNSSAFRMNDDVPLVVPEVNPEAIDGHRGYIANPNCSTIQLVMALKPIHDHFGLKRVVVSTYQSVSGAGQGGIDELSAQTVALFNQEDYEAKVFPYQIAFNAIPQIGPFGYEGYSEEELKATNETRKILGVPDLPVSCTAVRIPTFACHGESVMIEVEKEASPEALREVMNAFPGVRVVDRPEDNLYPIPTVAVDLDDVLVGRVRRDLSAPNAFLLWIVADNLLKGAALNAVQIAEALIKRSA
jgi:aspartate-semialdehyde dehydrogenase